MWRCWNVVASTPTHPQLISSLQVFQFQLLSNEQSNGSDKIFLLTVNGTTGQ